ncbi:MAG: radical SAM protein, partial [Anaerolineales bacterium]
MKVFFDIVGCRLNQSEAENLANSFRALGHQIVGDAAQADIAIINTCAVTTKAAADSRKKLRRASRLGAKQVIATGCWATLYPKCALKLEGVTKVYPNLKKDEIVADILHISPDLISSEDLIRVPLPGERARTRAFIKVQEGCNHHCTYCLTRVARGKSQSRSINEIRRDIHSAVVGGAKEIVLTGVQLGSWGRDFDKSLRLKDLLINVLNLDGFDRLRLSSIEPWDFDENMINLWKDNRLCRH